MIKKFFMIALMLGVSLNGFSKNEKFNSMDAAVAAAENSVKTDMQSKVNELLLERLKNKLETNEGKKPDFGNLKKSQQFIYTSSKVADLYAKDKVGKDASQLQEIYNKITNNDNKKRTLPAKFDFTKPILRETQIDTTNNKITYRIPVSFEVHTITNDKASDAKYSVTIYYIGEIKKHTDKKTNEVYYTIAKSKLDKNSDVIEKDMLSADVIRMKGLASKAISNWYNELPANLDSKYTKYVNNNMGIKPVTDKGIELKQDGKTFKATGNPIIIDFAPTIPSDSAYLYTNPTATITIRPLFTIVFDDDLTNIKEFNIKYQDEIQRAETDIDKVSHFESAYNTMNNFSNSLSAYVTDNNKDIQEILIAMFIDSKNDEVAVSHRNKYNNKEIIQVRKAEKYLQRIKGNSLVFGQPVYIDSIKAKALNEAYPELGLVYDPNLYTVMFEVFQQYDSQNYKDNTRKIVVMKIQNDKSYLIERIIVVPESTNLE